ncbi:MAG: DUF4238 domain-containing protein [Nitrospirae bacterium]|nr:DUF4238 domain-containing protein [Nitrospirota bacterium]
MSGLQLQHYVPRFLLNNFSVGESSQIFVFDKHEDVLPPLNLDRSCLVFD